MIGSAKQRIAEAVIHLVKEANIGLSRKTTLLPRSDCETVLAELKARSGEGTNEVQAAEAARTLIGMYPARQVHDAEIYSKAVTTVFMAAQYDFVRRVVDPVNGIPRRCKFLPTIAEISDALAAENARRTSIWLTAQWMLEEHDRRKAEEEERAKWAHLSPEELERRRAQVATLLGGRGPGDWTGEGEP
jgi:hypothetical protein